MNFNKANQLSKSLAGASSVSSKLGFRGDVQGLRAIAVLAVILFHADKIWLPAGFLGVDIFFVISGFIISSIIIGRNESFSWRGFYWGRVKRIVPAYIVMLALVSVVSALVFIPGDFSFFKQSLRSAALFLSNQYFSGFGSYFAPGAHELPLLHTWSLAIEMQFYLFLPVVIWLTPRKWLAGLLASVCVILFAYAEWKLRQDDSQRHVYFSLLARVPEFLVGALVAVTRVGERWSPRVASVAGGLGLLVLGGCLWYTNEASFPGLASILPCLATGLLIAARQGVVSQVLSARGFVWVGAISYSLYLWHWPVLAFMRYYNGDELPLQWLCVFFVITFLVSSASYYWVEKPMRSNSHFWGRPAGILITVVLVCLVVSISLRLNASIEKKLPVEMTRYAPPNEICHGQIVGDCIRGDHKEKPSVLVIGDSHAAQLNEFFDVVGEKNQISAKVITGSSCVPISGFDVGRLPEYAQAACRSQIAAAAPYIDQANVIVLAAMWQWQVPSVEFMKALSSFMEQAALRNTKVIVLAQVPMFDISLLRVRRFTELGLPVRISENKDWARENAQVAALVGRFKGAEFVDLSRTDFFAHAPFYDGQLIYMDNSHLNELGAKSYGAFAAPLLKTLLVPAH